MMPSAMAKNLCQCCGGSDDVRHLVLFGVVSVNICRRCRIHFCVSDEEAGRGRVDSAGKPDGWREGMRAMGEVFANEKLEHAARIEDHIRLAIRPRPVWMPRFIWRRLLHRLLVMEHWGWK